MASRAEYQDLCIIEKFTVYWLQWIQPPFKLEVCYAVEEKSWQGNAETSLHWSSK